MNDAAASDTVFATIPNPEGGAPVSPGAPLLDPAALKAFLQDFEDHLAEGQADTFSKSYFESHRARFRETLLRLPPAPHAAAVAIEVGATALFQTGLGHLFGYGRVLGVILDDAGPKTSRRTFRFGPHTVENDIVSLDVEREFFPLANESVDLVVFAEVLEHMDIDPMAALQEFNRILRPGGRLLITTPNSTSSRNVRKILLGYRPHFFMQYEKSRSPLRHNFEHDIHSVFALLGAAGFGVDLLETRDVFEEPCAQTMEFLRVNGFECAHRGDDIFALATKAGPVRDRWPSTLYV